MIKTKLFLTYKTEGLLWSEMLNELRKLEENTRSKNNIISFPNVFERLCTKFSMTKAKMWNCLFFLREFGLVEVVRGRGIRLKYKINNL